MKNKLVQMLLGLFAFLLIPFNVDAATSATLKIDCNDVEIPNFYIDVNTGRLVSEDSGSSEAINFELIDNELSIRK